MRRLEQTSAIYRGWGGVKNCVPGSLPYGKKHQWMPYSGPGQVLTLSTLQLNSTPKTIPVLTERLLRLVRFHRR